MLLLLALLGCTADTTPAWGFDPITIQPLDDGLTAVQTWEVFGQRWERQQRKRHYLCGVVVALELAPTEPCADCTQAWEVLSAEVSDSDCPSADAARYTALRRIALGPAVPSLQDDDPYPGDSVGSFVDYGEQGGDVGWEPHGWAYPAVLDDGGAPGEGWDDRQAFTLWPGYAWTL